MAAELITDLADERALRILEAVTQARLNRAEQPPDWSGEPAGRLREAFGVPQPTGPLTNGEVARAALLLLTEDPETRQAIESMAQHMPASRQAFVDPDSVALTAAVLVALQSHIELKRGPNGKWSFSYVKQAASASLLKPLLAKLVAWLP